MSQSEVVLYIACSVDGFVATSDGGVSWLEEFDDHYEGGVDGGSYDAFFESIDCLVMGSYTYEQISGFGEWPYGETPTYVLTHRELVRESETVEFYDGELQSLVDELRGRYERIWLVGGAVLAQDFLEKDLLDRIRLSVIPVVLGEGIRLFDRSERRHDLHLENVTTYETGITELHYVL